MNTDKLARQLKKELTRNPKKTAALAIISVVALWLWGPLAWKWIAGDQSDSTTTQAATAPKAPNQSLAAASKEAGAAVKSQLPKFTWDELLAKIARDERMQPANLAALPRDPFATSAAEQSIVDSLQSNDTNIASASPRVLPAEPTPQSLGLKLEGTLITSQRRRATISGEHYEEGERVAFETAKATPSATPTTGANADSKPAVEFLVELVEPRRVVLSRNEIKYELMLVRATLSGRDTLVFGSLQEEQ